MSDYSFKYDFPEYPQMKVQAEYIVKMVKKKIDNGEADKTVSVDDSGKPGRSYYEIPKNQPAEKRPVLTLDFVKGSMEIMFSGVIMGKIKDPGGLEGLFEECASVNVFYD